MTSIFRHFSWFSTETLTHEAMTLSSVSPQPLAVCNIPSFSGKWPIWGTYISGRIRCLSFRVWHISLHVTSSRFIHVITRASLSFLFTWNNTTLLCLLHFNHPFLSMDIWGVSTFWLMWIMLLQTSEYKCVFKSLLSIPLLFHMLDCIMILCLDFWETEFLPLHSFGFCGTVHIAQNFKVSNSVACSIFTMLCDRHLSLVPSHHP